MPTPVNNNQSRAFTAPSIKSTNRPNMNAATAVLNSAEEAGARFSEKMQADRSKQEKKTSVSNQSQLHRRIQSIEKVEELSKLIDTYSEVKSKAKQITDAVNSGRDLRNWVEEQQEQGSENASIYLALKSAYISSKDEAKDIIDTTTKNFIADNAVSIQTSFNVANSVAKSYPDKDYARNMRMAIGEGNQRSYDVRSIMATLVKHFGDSDFGRSVDTYTRSIRDDLKSISPSTNPIYLEDTLKNLHAANGARSIVINCGNVLLEAKAKSIDKDFAVRLALNVLELIEGKIYDSELEDITDEYANPKRSDQLKFLNRLYPMIKELPSPLWEDEEQRDEGLKDIIRHMESATVKDIGLEQFKALSVKVAHNQLK